MSDEVEPPRPEPEIDDPEERKLALVEAFRAVLAAGSRDGGARARLEESLTRANRVLAGYPGGAWSLADAALGAEALRAALEAAGVTLDAGQAAALDGLLTKLAPDFAAAAETMVLSSYARRLRLGGEPHPGVTAAIETYVCRVDEANRGLEARYGRGFVEAVASGPTPHTEAARLARERPGYGARELEARAELWKLQAELEKEMAPYLDEAARERLASTPPTALRILVTPR